MSPDTHRIRKPVQRSSSNILKKMIWGFSFLFLATCCYSFMEIKSHYDATQINKKSN